MPVRNIEGLDEVRQILGEAVANATLRRPMLRGLLRLHAHIGDYSRSLGAPSARYMRGRGAINAQGIVLRLTSQNLGKRWTEEIREDAGELTGVLGNTVSYGPYVHGSDGDLRQAGMHRDRGARTDAQVIDDEAGWIQSEFDRTIQSVFDGMGAA